MKRKFYKIEIYKFNEVVYTYTVNLKDTSEAYFYALGLYNGLSTYNTELTGYHYEEFNILDTSKN